MLAQGQEFSLRQLLLRSQNAQPHQAAWCGAADWLQSSCNQTKKHKHLNLLLGRDGEYFGQANLIAWERGKITAEESLGFEVRAPLLQPQPVGSAQECH